jgi:hypothetical protein
LEDNLFLELQKSADDDEKFVEDLEALLEIMGDDEMDEERFYSCHF